MKIAAAAPFLSEIRLDVGFSPFLRNVVASAVLAALLLKFSSIVAPGWGVQVTAWATTFLYLYFALARAAFLRTHCIARGKALDEASLARAAMAFNVALASRRWSLSLLVAAGLAMGAAADMGLSGASAETHETVANRILAAAILVWFAWCPRFLVACGAWAVEGSFALGRANALVGRLPGRFRTGWIVAVAVIAAVSLGANAVLYFPLRGLVVAVLPSARAVYLFSAAFYAAIIAFQLALQSAFAAWIAPLLLSAKDEAAPSLEKQGARPGAWICRAIGLARLRCPHDDAGRRHGLVARDGGAGARLGARLLGARLPTRPAAGDHAVRRRRRLPRAPSGPAYRRRPGRGPDPRLHGPGRRRTHGGALLHGRDRGPGHDESRRADRLRSGQADGRPSRPAHGLSWIVWALAILFGGLGALFFWLAERIRRRGTGSAGAG